MKRHLFTTDVIRHALDMRNDDICVLDGCGERRDSAMHESRFAEQRQRVTSSEDLVCVRRSDLVEIVDFLRDDCRFDHEGYCQAHTLSDDCPVPRLRFALEKNA